MFSALDSITYYNTEALLEWVPWVPRNPSIFQQWVPEPIIFGAKEQQSNHFFMGKYAGFWSSWDVEKHF